MDKVEYEFPDEKETKAKVAQSLAKTEDDEPEIELKIVDDTPPQDRGRKPMAEPPEDVTDDELSQYDEKVQKRLKKFTKGYHDERREKEAALREREAAENFARQMYEENMALQRQLSEGSKIFIEQGKSAAQLELGFTGRDVEFVVRHQNLLRLNFEKFRQSADRFARQVHVGLRLKQPNGLAVDGGTGHQAVIAALGHQRHFEFSGHSIDPPESGVVAGVFVFVARIAQAD